MDLNAAIAIANRNIATLILIIVYAVGLFYIILMGSLGLGNILYSYYSLDIEPLILLVGAFIVFYPGYLYSQLDMFRRTIRKESKSFNLMTNIMIIESFLAFPITLAKLALIIILSSPAFIFYYTIGLNIIIILLILIILLVASIIAEYVFMYSYYFRMIGKLSILESIKKGVSISLANVNSISYFSLYYLAQLVQLIPIINIIVIFWLPIIYILITGNVLKK